MKSTILGFEISEGVSKKNGEAYSIGQLHTLMELAPARGGKNVSKGFVGVTFRCDAPLLRKIEQLRFPCEADVQTKSVMQYGKPETMVIDIAPMSVERKVA